MTLSENIVDAVLADLLDRRGIKQAIRSCDDNIREKMRVELIALVKSVQQRDFENAMSVIVQDDDGHWYVIPADRRQEFDSWGESEGEDSWIAPDWAVRVGGSPSLVEFNDYVIKG